MGEARGPGGQAGLEGEERVLPGEAPQGPEEGAGVQVAPQDREVRHGAARAGVQRARHLPRVHGLQQGVYYLGHFFPILRPDLDIFENFFLQVVFVIFGFFVCNVFLHLVTFHYNIHHLRLSFRLTSLHVNSKLCKQEITIRDFLITRLRI